MRRRFVVIALVGVAAAALAQESVRESALDPGVRNVLAPALAEWIAQSRDDAVARGVDEIPVEIRAAFENFIPIGILESVRWRVDGDTDLAGMLVFQSGTIRAVTLDNVILFASAEEAANVKLWAHELYHVMQYREWGIGGFAQRFVGDHRTLERDAREFRWSWMRATGRVPKV